MQTEINKSKVIELLMDAGWSWVTCGGRVRESDMNEYCAEIKERISEDAIGSVLSECTYAIQQEYVEGLENNEESKIGTADEYAARSIADQVARSLVTGVHESVSFIAYI